MGIYGTARQATVQNTTAQKICQNTDR